MRTITFIIPGMVQPKERPRLSRKTGRVFTPSTTQASEAKVLLSYRAAAPGLQEPLRFAVGLSAMFYIPDRRWQDLDNMVKTIKDALKGVAWVDDAQVCRMVTDKDLDPANPRVEVTIIDCGPNGLFPKAVLTPEERKRSR